MSWKCSVPLFRDGIACEEQQEGEDELVDGAGGDGGEDDVFVGVDEAADAEVGG